MRHPLAVIPLALVFAGCSSGGQKSVALPPIATPTTTPSRSPSQSPAAGSPAVVPTLITETIAPASSAPRTAPTGSTLTTYTNARFGFSAKYPADFTKATPPVDGDGQLFNSPDEAASFTVTAVNNNNRQTVDQVYASATAPAADTSITYANKSGDVVTVSGTRGSRVFYERQTVGAGSIDELMWTYPVADKATFDPLVTLTVRNYTAGDVTSSH